MASGELDIAEFGSTYFLRMFDLDDSLFLALPIFPNRNFRHSSLFVNVDSGIEKPEDLAGKTVGECALWGSDPGVWMKGVLAEEYGVTPDRMSWMIGGTDHPVPAFDWIPQPVPDDVEVRHAEDGRTLAAMLEAGEIDAFCPSTSRRLSWTARRRKSAACSSTTSPSSATTTVAPAFIR